MTHKLRWERSKRSQVRRQGTQIERRTRQEKKKAVAIVCTNFIKLHGLTVYSRKKTIKGAHMKIKGDCIYILERMKKSKH